MPRQIVRAPDHDRSRSLGWLGLEWLEHFTVHGPGDVQGEPVTHGDEYSGLVADCYALDATGRRLYDSAFISRPKGCDKSGMGSRFGLLEAFGPCRFDRWAVGGETYRFLDFVHVYEPGEPIGRPVRVPYIRCMATEETQTGNVFDSIYFNLKDGPLSEVEGVDVGLTRILLPGGGEITPSTASSSAKDGGKETWADFDESHLYFTPELRRMYTTVRRNMRKRMKTAETWSLETTTMYAPGQESIAEATYKLAEAAKDNRRPYMRSRLLFDHRWGEVESVFDEPKLRAALVDAYGDAMAWMNLDSLVDEFHDTRSDIADSRRYFLNALVAASDAWMNPAAWAACTDSKKSLHDGDEITLGFDGSVNNDSTGLVACRLEDRHLQVLGMWEKPDSDVPWEVDREAVDAAVAGAFDRYKVVAFYADPALWQDYVDRWTKEFAGQLEQPASKAHPIEWWMNRPIAVVAMLERMSSAVMAKQISHDGDSVFARHVNNARERRGRSGITIAKEFPNSRNKIDLAYCAALALEACGDVTASGRKVRTGEAFFR